MDKANLVTMAQAALGGAWIALSPGAALVTALLLLGLGAAGGIVLAAVVWGRRG